MKLEPFFLSFFPPSLLLLFLYFLCFLSFLPSCLSAFLSSLWEKVLMSSNNLSILQLLMLIAIKLITHIFTSFYYHKNILKFYSHVIDLYYISL